MPCQIRLMRCRGSCTPNCSLEVSSYNQGGFFLFWTTCRFVHLSYSTIWEWSCRHSLGFFWDYFYWFCLAWVFFFKGCEFLFFCFNKMRSFKFLKKKLIKCILFKEKAIWIYLFLFYFSLFKWSFIIILTNIYKQGDAIGVFH